MAKTPAKLTSRAPLAAVVVGEVSELVVMLVAMLGVIVELRIVLRTGAVGTGREVTVVADFVLSLGFPTFSMVDWAAASCSSKNINCASHRVLMCAGVTNLKYGR